uniref:Amidophosphoribosyltransferase n=1 Tax=Oryza brachyantha TaxID=4533 RepID=J3M7G8_ORYBR
MEADVFASRSRRKPAWGGGLNVISHFHTMRLIRIRSATFANSTGALRPRLTSETATHGDSPCSEMKSIRKLQHRGEEGAGIVAVGGDGKLKSVTGLGLVADVFGDPARLASLPGPPAIGHVRYSTAGAAASLRNVQPFLAGYRFGQVAVAHNGNLVNYQALRNKLEARGSIFNTSSDTEVILHLIATSLSRPLLSRICDACERLAGAYSLLFLTADKMFAHIYFALPNSVVFSHAVHERRTAFGRALAEESPAPGADVVIPVPDSGFYAALGFARASGLEFQQGLIRWHYSGRSFIQPTQAIRDLAVKLKLAPVHGVIRGKSVVVVDDSLVRGTTSSKIVRLLRDAGAREVHMRIASPPVVGSCLYGIDTPSEGELISNRMDLEGVRREIGSDSLAFLSLDKLHSIYGAEAEGYCDACFSRKYPVLPTLPEPVMEVEE